MLFNGKETRKRIDWLKKCCYVEAPQEEKFEEAVDYLDKSISYLCIYCLVVCELYKEEKRRNAKYDNK